MASGGDISPPESTLYVKAGATSSLDSMPVEAREYILQKSLRIITSICPDNLPKTGPKLQNILRPCTTVVPYTNPLDALFAANESATLPHPTVQVPCAKRKVYTGLDKLKEAHKSHRSKMFAFVAPLNSDIEKTIMEGAILWLKSDPEGTEESLTTELLRKCTERFGSSVYTVPPARLYGANKSHIRRREVSDDKVAKSANAATAGNEESGPKPTQKVKIAIGVEPGENRIRETMGITPKGLTGIEVSVTGRALALPKQSKKAGVKKHDNPERLRAVGQSKALSEVFGRRLTEAVRDNNAILVHANDQEKKLIISKVFEWVDRCRESARQAKTAMLPNQRKQTISNLHQQLANLCVGKARRLSPASLVRLLQDSGYISIDGASNVAYQLTASLRDTSSSWQEQTVEAAVKRCNFSKLLREAYPRKRKRKNKKPGPSKTSSKAKIKEHTASGFLDEDDISDHFDDPDPYDFDQNDPFDYLDDPDPDDIGFDFDY